jgi:hypothetical protein
MATDPIRRAERIARPALADAAKRLRDVPGFPRRPGRPRKVPLGHVSGTPAVEGSTNAQVSREAVDSRSIAPRLLDLRAAAQYLAVSPWTIRDLEAAGTLRRVRVPLAGHAELRRVLFDRLELDALVDRWKEPQR